MFTVDHQFGWRRLTLDAKISSAVCIALLVTSAPLPWLFGGVHATVKLVTAALLLVPAVIAALLAWRDRAAPSGILGLLIALELLGVLQLIPVPRAVHTLASPSAHQTRAQLASDHAELKSVPITLDVGLTREELALIALVTAFALAANVATRSSYILRFSLAVLALNGGAIAFFGIAQKLSWNGMLYHVVPLVHEGYPFAAFFNRNAAGGFLNISLGAAIAWMFTSMADSPFMRRYRAKRERPRSVQEAFWRWIGLLNAETLVALVCAVFCAAGVVASASRGAALSGAIALLALAVCLLLHRRFILAGWLFGGGLALTLLLVVMFDLSGEVQQRLQQTVNSEETDGRLVHWSYMTDAIGDFWRTGAGIGTYRYVHRLYDQETGRKWYYHAENQYLETFVNAGVPGMLLLLAAILLSLWWLWRCLQRQVNPFAQAIGYGALYTIVSQLIHACFDFGLYLPANAFAFTFMLCALGNACPTNGRRPRAAHPADAGLRRGSWSRPLRLAALTGALAMHVFALYEYRKLSVVELARCNSRVVDDPFVAAAPTSNSTARIVWPWFAPKRPLNEPTLRRAIANLEQAVPYRSYDGQLLLELAHLRLKLYRLRAYRRLSAEQFLVKRSSIWHMTSPVAYQQRLQAMGSDQPERVQALRDVDELLKPAWRELTATSRVSPLIGRTYLVQAQIAPLLGIEVDVRWIDRALLLAGGEADLILVAAVLKAQHGEITNALPQFRRAIRLRPVLASDVTQFIRQLPDSPAPDTFLPDRPQAWFDAANHYLDEPNERERLIHEGLRLAVVQQKQLGTVTSLRLQAAGWQQLGQLGEARTALTKALALEPQQIELRLSLVDLLMELGQYEDARAHLAEASKLVPNDKRIVERKNRLDEAVRQRRDYPPGVSAS